MDTHVYRDTDQAVVDYADEGVVVLEVGAGDPPIPPLSRHSLVLIVASKVRCSSCRRQKRGEPIEAAEAVQLFVCADAFGTKDY